MARNPSQEYWKDDLLWCNHCKSYKDPIDFATNYSNTLRGNKNSYCKECVNEISRVRRNTKYQNSLDRILKERYNSITSRSKQNKLINEITLDYLYEIYNKQEGRCAISNIPMTNFCGKGRVLTNISVDRIDCKIGYTKNNIQLVCMAVNQMKNDLGIEQLLYFCKEIVTNNEED